jgi:saccharopine dehydrogenase (NAD+, L-lysine-forming)
MAKIWLRCETKPNEKRRALSPEVVKELIANKHQIIVEDSKQSIYTAEDYKKVGAEVVKPLSWKEAPEDAYILGLKELDDEDFPLKHKHIYFAHAYKNQDGWVKLMNRFNEGGGTLFDLEYLTDKDNRRIAAFGYWAGYVGAALSTLIYAWYKYDHGNFTIPTSFDSVKDLIKFVKGKRKLKINTIVIGSNGRSGQGACDFFENMKFDIAKWDRDETEKGGPFPEIMGYDIFINCVLMNKKNPPFLTKETIATPGRLTVIGDVSCDPTGPFNSLPIYEKATSLQKPIINLSSDVENPLYLMAIDNLPTMLPRESSHDFATQLSKHINKVDRMTTPWENAFNIFKVKSHEAKGQQ